MGSRHPGDPTARRETVTAEEAALSTAAISAAQACTWGAMKGSDERQWGSVKEQLLFPHTSHSSWAQQKIHSH